MSRNTDDRLGAAHTPEHTESPPVAAAPTETPGFNWAVPTEFVTLPTRGRFYPEGHPLHNQEAVEIRYMTAKEEDILTSRALLKEGVALDRLLENLLVNKQIDVNSLFVGDKNALIVAARITGYGAEYETSVACPSCGESTDYEFDLGSVAVTDTDGALETYSAVHTEANTFIVTLPLSKVQAECRMMTGADENKIAKEMQRKARKKMASSALTDQIRAFLVSVNGSTDAISIERFIAAMPARDSRFLRTFYMEAMPNIDLSQTFECSSCGYSADMEVPLTANFFWPK